LNLVLFQECVGPQLSATRLIFPEASITCENITEAAVVRHMVTLGVACETTTMYSYYSDLLFECAESSDDFQKIVDEYGIEGVRLACREAALFTTGSSQSQVIPPVGISTNEYWHTGSDGYCFDQVAVPRSPSAPTTSQPVAIPATPFPTITKLDPTLAPSNRATLKPTTPPTTTPRISFNMSAPVLPANISKSSNSGVVIGAVVGGLAAGIAIMAVVGVFMLRNKRSSSTREKVEVDSRRPSETGSGTGNGAPSTDSTRMMDPHHGESSTSSMPTTSLIPTKPNYSVTYKDQSRSVVGVPTNSSRDHVPIAVAVNVDASSVRSASTRAQPPGCRLED
jgi:hypothetical protein